MPTTYVPIYSIKIADIILCTFCINNLLCNKVHCIHREIYINISDMIHKRDVIQIYEARFCWINKLVISAPDTPSVCIDLVDIPTWEHLSWEAEANIIRSVANKLLNYCIDTDWIPCTLNKNMLRWNWHAFFWLK